MLDKKTRNNAGENMSTRRKAPGRSSTGISNRESPAEEAQERKAYPQLDPKSPPPEDAGGSIGEPEVRTLAGHTSHKAGSLAMPAPRDRQGSLHQSETRTVTRRGR